MVLVGILNKSSYIMYIKNMVMRFENLVFLSHPVTPKSGIMAKINLDNGKEISVICGEGFYSSSRKGNRALCTSVEDAASFVDIVRLLNVVLNISAGKDTKLPNGVLLNA